MFNIVYNVSYGGTSTARPDGNNVSPSTQIKGKLQKASAQIFDPDIHRVSRSIIEFSGLEVKGNYAGLVMTGIGYVDGMDDTIKIYDSAWDYVGIETGILTRVPNQGDRMDTSFWCMTGKNERASIKINNATITFTIVDKYSKSSAVTENANFEDPYAQRPSDGQAVNVGNVVRLNNPNAAVLKHVVTWNVGAITDPETGEKTPMHSHSQEAGIGESTATFLLPKDWMDACPTSTSALMHIIVDTYYPGASGDKLVGSQSYTRMAYVPTSVVPAYDGIYVTRIDHTPTGYANKKNIYFQTLTGVYVTIKNPKGGYCSGDLPERAISFASSTMSDYHVRIDMEPQDAGKIEEYNAWKSAAMNQPWWEEDATYEAHCISRLTGLGDTVLSVSIRDARKRVCDTWRNTTDNQPINVMQYNAPVIASASAVRCDANGVANSSGTFATLKIAASTFEFKIADEYEKKPYQIGDYVYYRGVMYKCITNIVVPPETFDESQWVRMTTNNMRISAWYYIGTPGQCEDANHYKDIIDDKWQTVVYDADKNRIRSLRYMKVTENKEDGTVNIDTNSEMQQYQENGQYQYNTTYDMTSGTSYLFGSNDANDMDYVNPNLSYTIVFVVTDDAGGESYAAIGVNSTEYALHIHRGGDGVAVGTVSQSPNVFEIAKQWDMKYKGILVSPIVFSPVQPEHIDNLIWVKPRQG